MDARIKFLKVYANLPLASRDEIVVVVGTEPVTWNVAKLEIEQDPITEKGKEILGILQSLQILK